MPAFANPITCSIETQGANSVLRCLGANGRPARMWPAQENNVTVEFGLTLLGCPVPTIDGDLEDADGAIACVQAMYGLEAGPLSRVDFNAIYGAGRAGRNPEGARRFMEARGYRTGQARAAEQEAQRPPDFTAHANHPDAAAFTYPTDRNSLLSAEVDSVAWRSGRQAGGGVQTRWADPDALSGRTLAVFEGDVPRFLARFGNDGVSITSPDGDTVMAGRTTRNGLPCLVVQDLFDNECLGIVLQSGGNATQPWTMRAAFQTDHHRIGGFPVPLPFGRAVEDVALWEASVGQRSAEREGVAATLASDEALDALPLDGLTSGFAAMMASTYEEPASFSAASESYARLPFIAYHHTFASVCRENSAEPFQVYELYDRVLRDFSAIPYQRYRIYETVVVSRTPIQTRYFDRYAAAMAELPQALLNDSVGGDREVTLVDLMERQNRQINMLIGNTSLLLERIGCAGPTVDRLEENLAASFDLR
jgi:hypothetical protein